LMAISAPPFTDYTKAQDEINELLASLAGHDMNPWPMIIVTEDAQWMGQTVQNFLWATFTRSQPSKDVYGASVKVVDKHWTCSAPLIIDARIKPHHAPVLVPDHKVVEKVDRLFAKGGSLHGKIKGL
jgi:4-hydroxy-3-polyprenylbenzoate decarboxylase